MRKANATRLTPRRRAQGAARKKSEARVNSVDEKRLQAREKQKHESLATCKRISARSSGARRRFSCAMTAPARGASRSPARRTWSVAHGPPSRAISCSIDARVENDCVAASQQRVARWLLDVLRSAFPVLADPETDELHRASLVASVRRLPAGLWRLQWSVTADPALEENGHLDLEVLQDAARGSTLPGCVRAIRLAPVTC